MVVAHDTLVSTRCDRVMRMQQGQLKQESEVAVQPDVPVKAVSRDTEIDVSA